MPDLPTWAYTFIAVGLTATWIVLNLLDPLLNGYTVDPGMHIVMGSLVGVAWGGRALKGRDNDG